MSEYRNGDFHLGADERIETWGSSHVTGSVGKHTLTGVEVHGDSKVNLPGAVILKTPKDVESLEDWIDYYGLKGTRAKIVVFKLVHDDLQSEHGALYEIGTKVTAECWSSEPFCGGGLHFSPSPSATHRYGKGTRYLRCEVLRKDVVLLGDKLKAKACKVICEVDVDGEPLDEAAA